MSSVTESVDVEAPISTVYNQWTQFESFPQFMGGVDSITQTDDTHTHWVTSIGGQRREFDAEITEQHPEERVAWTSTDGTDQAGVVERAGSVLGVDDHQVKADLARFKHFIEARGSESGAWRGDIEAGS